MATMGEHHNDETFPKLNKQQSDYLDTLKGTDPAGYKAVEDYIKAMGDNKENSPDWWKDLDLNEDDIKENFEYEGYEVNADAVLAKVAKMSGLDLLNFFKDKHLDKYQQLIMRLEDWWDLELRENSLGSAGAGAEFTGNGMAHLGKKKNK